MVSSFNLLHESVSTHLLYLWIIHELFLNFGAIWRNLVNFGETRVVGALWAPPRSLRLPGQGASFFNNPTVTNCATGNVLTLLETILCKFGQICATGNALMQLGATLYKSGQICETGNALMPLETILCEHGQICAKGNDLVQLEPNLCN